MDFRAWLENSGYDNHDILVVHDGEELALHPVQSGEARQFMYDKDDGYETTFRIVPFQSQKKGSLRAGGRADFVGIIQDSRIHQGKGTDVAFLKSLHSMLTEKNIRPVPYKSVGLGMFGGLIKSAMKDAEFKGKKNIQSQIDAAGGGDFKKSDIPDFSTGAANTIKATRAVSVGSPTGSWSLFFHVGHSGAAGYFIDMVLKTMKGAIKPLMDNGLVMHYKISSGTKDLEYVSSNAGEDEDAKFERETKSRAGYIKFLVDTAIPSRPAAAVVKESLDLALSRIGFKPSEISASKLRVDIDELKKFAQQADSHVVAFFVDAVKSDDENKYRVLDELAKVDEKWRSSLSHPHDALIYYYEELLNGDWDQYVEKPLLYAHSAMECLENEDFFEKVARNEYHSFKRQYEEAVNKALSNERGKYMARHEKETLVKLSRLIKIEGLS